MTATSPAFVVPKTDLALVQLTGATIAADGTWTIGTTYTMDDYVDSVALDVGQDLEPAMSIDSPFMNRVLTFSDFTMTMVEMERREYSAGAPAPGPMISKILVGYPSVVAEYVVGISSGDRMARTITGYGAWELIRTGSAGVGTQRMGITIKQQDVSYGASGILPLTIAIA